jgi:serine/threonine protein kinase
MVAAAPGHPRRELLEAFGLGKLSPDDASAIEVHLASCTECGLAVSNTPADHFVGLVRAARRLGGVSPAAAPTEAYTGTNPCAPPGAANSPKAREDRDEAVSDFHVPPDLFGHPRYRVLSLLGQGGMGAVYVAEHRLMERCVALKMIGRDLSSRPQLVERFRREVRAAAQLSHPNIVTAYDAEQAGQTHFLVMEYVEGTDLARLVARRGALPVEEACEYVRQAAFGLQHAHEKGMIHRDIKPHNLMVTPAGQVKILDFGLARFVREAGSETGAVTALGMIMGTPDYMAPEQASDAHQVDIRADIYSLGCTLYFLLAGRVPFPTGAFLDKLVRHATEAPTPLHQLRPDLPADLVRVVERMMAKKPRHRYQTPAELAQALAPFAKGGAAPAPATRDPAAAFFASLLPAQKEIVSVTAHGSSSSGIPVAKAHPQRRQRIAAVAAVGLLIVAVAVLAQAVLRVQTPTGTLEIRTDDPDVKVTVSRNGKEVRVLDLKNEAEVRLEVGNYVLSLPAGNKDLKVEPDFLTIRRAGKEIAQVRRIPKQQPAPVPPEEPKVGEIRRFEGHQRPAVPSVAVSPDGRQALSGGEDKVIILWDLTTGREVRRFEGHEGRVMAVAFAPDGRRAVSGGEDKVLRLWDVASGKELRRLEGHADWVFRMAFSPDGRYILSGGGGTWANGGQSGTDLDLRLWEADTGKEVRRFRGHTEYIWSVTFSPDGRQALSASVDHTARVWDVATGKEVRRLDHPDRLLSAFFSPDGRHILTTCDDKLLRLWDAQTGKEVRRFIGHAEAAIWAVFSPDGRRVLSSSWGDHTLRLWDVDTGAEVDRITIAPDFPTRAEFTPDGRYALFGSASSTVRLWRLPDPPPVKVKAGN